MFLKREKSEMDDFERKKSLVLKEKYLNFNILKSILKRFFTDSLAKSSQNIFAYSFVSEHSKHYFYFEKKTIAGGHV